MAANRSHMKQAEAMCQVLWALPLECVLYYVQRGNASAIAYLSGNFASFDVARAVTVVSQVLASVLTAAGAFGLFKKAQA